MLNRRDYIPLTLADIPVDIVEIGTVKALSEGDNPKAKWRPVIFGISIGNMAITAGTNGWLFKRVKDEKVFFGSNAHVFCDDPSKTSEEIGERTIVQPGKYDGGSYNDKVGIYEWHKQIIPMEGLPSNCPTAKLWVAIYNYFAKIAGRKTRLLQGVVEGVNKIDFAVAAPTEEYLAKMLGLDMEGQIYVGEAFAGSDMVGIFCKASNIVAEGYVPILRTYRDIMLGDTVVKSGRTSGVTAGRVIDESAVITVDYGDFTADFEDVAIVDGSFLQGGDSGSAVWMHCQVN